MAARTSDTPPRDPWRGFAEHLVAAGRLTEEQVGELLRAAAGGRDPLPDLLVQRGLLAADEVRAELADYFGVEAVAAEEIPLDPVIMKHVPKALLLRYGCIPVRVVGVTVTLAMVDPGDEQALAELRRAVPASITPAVALAGDIVAAQQRAGVYESETERGDTAYHHVLDQARDDLTAGRPDAALAQLAVIHANEPAGGTAGGTRLSFATLEEQQAFAAEHPDTEVEWIDPAFGFARYLRGVALGDLARYADAAAELERAVAWDPVSDRAWLELGWARARAGRLEDAAAAYARAAALYAQSSATFAAQAHRGRGYCLAALGRRDEARAAYEAALRLDPKSEVAREAVAGLAPEPPAPPAASGRAPLDVIARLHEMTLAGSVVWTAADEVDEGERAFTCRVGDRDLRLSRTGPVYRLHRRAPDDEDQVEERDGWLRKSKRLGPLFRLVAERTRVLER